MSCTCRKCEWHLALSFTSYIHEIFCILWITSPVGYPLTWIQKEGKLFFVQLSVSIPVGSRKSSLSELNELFVRQLQTSVVDCIGVCKRERSLPQEVLLVAYRGKFIKNTLGPIVAISTIWGLHKLMGIYMGG